VAEPKKRILVVDDDKSILRTFTRILQKSGYEIETAETGKEAIEKAPDQVMDLFTKVSTSTDKTQAYKENGIAVRLYNEVVNGIKNLTDKAGATSSYSLYDNSLVGKEISDIDDRIDTLEDRLVDKENQYYTRFSALETAISKMNTQSSWLSQQFS
jgi:flagellar hook-associated protein 2